MKKELQRYLEKESEADRFSGSVIVTRDNKILFEYAFGFANKEKQIDNKINTKFNLASINKLFTSIAIAQLVEYVKISFDDLVGKYLPRYPNSTIREKVTIYNLLTHTSGLGSFINLKFRAEFLAVKEEIQTIDDVVKLFKDKPLPYKVGDYHYSADGYELLGAIIEAVSGENYYNYVRKNIFEVANMVNTDSYFINPENHSNDIAVGYTRRDPKTDRMIEGERYDNFELNLVKGTASGSGYSTCSDLVKFSQSLLENKLLNVEMTHEMLKQRIDLGSMGDQHKYQGYGFQVFDIRGVKRVGHPGRFAGVNARFDMYPELGYTVVVLANYDPPAAFNVAEKLTKLITI